MARAMGGEVVHDLGRAEIGTNRLWLTDAGKNDPVFGPLSDVFFGQMGHEDIVTRLPPGAVLLAFSQRVQNQAYCFPDRPIFLVVPDDTTLGAMPKFHPVRRDSLLADWGLLPQRPAPPMAPGGDR
jgi:GMP synthase (glutamine-hydrolysing)